MYYNTISQRYRQAFEVLKAIPGPLIGIMLVSQMITGAVATVFAIIPFLSVPVALMMTAGVSGVCLKATRGEAFGFEDVFSSFRSWETIKRVGGGMLQMFLRSWAGVLILIVILPYTVYHIVPNIPPTYQIALTAFISLWFFISFVILTVKLHTYAFVPFILISRPDIPAGEALSMSKRMTNGLKSRLFSAAVIPELLLFAVMTVVTAAALKAAVTGLIVVVFEVVVTTAFSIGFGLFYRLVVAGFYQAALTAPAPYGSFVNYSAPRDSDASPNL